MNESSRGVDLAIRGAVVSRFIGLVTGQGGLKRSSEKLGDRFLPAAETERRAKGDIPFVSFAADSETEAKAGSPPKAEQRQFAQEDDQKKKKRPSCGAGNLEDPSLPALPKRQAGPPCRQSLWLSSNTSTHKHTHIYTYTRARARPCSPPFCPRQPPAAPGFPLRPLLH